MYSYDNKKHPYYYTAAWFNYSNNVTHLAINKINTYTSVWLKASV